ncbi:MAG: hypothetical protein ACI8WB_001619 [Phenylobacterium sp.]|jgi:hypothetical protein
MHLPIRLTHRFTKRFSFDSLKQLLNRGISATISAAMLVIFLAIMPITAFATSLDDFFDQDVTFNPDIPTPESVLGYQVGDWHVRHDQLINYMTLLAQKSDRIKLDIIGYTHEQRPLILLSVAAPQKLKNIDNIRLAHLARLNGDKTSTSDVSKGITPGVIWMGYSVHGNEPSGSNAAMLVAYYLAAAQGEKIDRILNELVVLVDPSLNPDGLSRFAQWANSHKGSVANADPKNREHNESWPSGRTNHYWFDLNRDWLLLQHPESRARVAKFHQWKPNVLTDFHEMGTNSTYFFQPGITARKNPWTPQANVELTRKLAEHHAKAFDKQGQLYFTQESYDDFYYGKGSTYPDVNGGVGILFEQASSRGHVQKSVNGILTFPQTIKNQLTMSLSTFDGALANREALLKHQQKFYGEYASLASKDDLSGYIVSEDRDITRLEKLLDLLQRHQIKAYPLNKDWSLNNQTFAAKNSYYIPLKQPQYRLIKSIFSERKSFEDNSFYDVSSWNLAHAFNIEFKPVSSQWGLKFAEQAWQQAPAKKLPTLAQSYAYAFSWDDQRAPLLLQRLLADRFEIRVATLSFSASVDANGKTVQKTFAPGSIVVNRGLQRQSNWLALLQQAQDEVGLAVDVVKSGLTAKGIDLGSRSMEPVYMPKILLVGGQGTSQYEVGEVWHFLNKQLALAPTIVDQDKLGSVDLANYTHMLLTSSDFNKISDKTLEKIKRWLKQGGVIWGQKKGAQWLVKNELLKVTVMNRKEMARRFKEDDLNYGEQEALEAQQRIAGAIFSVELDLSHPLTWGYHRATLPVFKNSTMVMLKPKRSFVRVGTYSKYPQLSGYAAKTNVNKIADSTFMMAHSVGKGLVIGVADDVNFRGFWYGTNRLMTNSLYFSGVVEAKGE